MHRSNLAQLVDHLVGAYEHGAAQLNAERRAVTPRSDAFVRWALPQCRYFPDAMV
jgi:hypothetical protein